MCVCVREIERERECVCVREIERERVCVCLVIEMNGGRNKLKYLWKKTAL